MYVWATQGAALLAVLFVSVSANGLLGGLANNIGDSQTLNDGTTIKGNQNLVSSLLNLKPQVDADVSLLNSVKQLQNGGGHGPYGGSGNAPNNIGSSQIQNTGTHITGLGNKESSLLNVSPQVGVGVNALNKVNQVGGGGAGAGGSNNIGSSQILNDDTTIKGNQNLVASLLNLNPQLDIDVNLLNAIQQLIGKKSKKAGAPSSGNNIGGSQTQHSGTNIDGSGNTVASLLNFNPQVDADVNLLNSVKQIVGGAAGGSAKGPLHSSGAAPNNIGGSQQSNSGSNIRGSGNSVASLLNVGPQIGANVNALNTVSQTASGAAGQGSAGAGNNIGGSQTQNSGTNIAGSGNIVASLLNVNPQVDAVVNALNTVNQAGSAGGNAAPGGIAGGGLGNNIGGSQTQNSGTNIAGSGNTVASLLNVNPQVGVGVNALNAVNQAGSGGGNAASGGIAGGGLGNNIGGSQTQNSGTNIAGSGNTVASLLNVLPQVGVGVNALNAVNHAVSEVGNAASGGIAGGVLGSGNNIGGSQTQNTGKNIVGSGNTVAELLNVNPQVDLGVNLLNSVKQSAGGLTDGKGGAANNIGSSQSINDGTSIVGNDNKVLSLANVKPQIGADVNLLNSVAQGGKGDNGKDGLLGGALGGDGPVGGLLGGDGPVGGLLGENGPVGGLLGGDGPVGGLLGENGPVGGLLGGEGPVGGLLGGDGPVGGLFGGDGLVGGLLGSDGLVGGLLGGDGLVGGLLGSNGPVDGLLGGEGPVGGLLGGDGPVGGLLGGSSGASSGGSNQIGSQQQTNDAINIHGDNNQVSTLANVNPQIGINLGLLNQVEQAVGAPFPHPNDDSLVCENFIGSVQQQNSGTNIVGDGNKVLTGIDVSPQINLDLNLLNNVRQVVICRPRVKATIKPPTRPPITPTIRPPTRPPPTLPTLPPYPPTRPPIRPTIRPPPTLRPYPPTRPPYRPTLPPLRPTPPPVLPTEPPCIELNNIGGAQEQSSGTNIVGDNNQVLTGINISPQVDLDINLLNSVQQTQQGRPLVICKPTPAPILPTTPPPTPSRRCYLRHCRRWGHKVSTHCCDNCLPPTPAPPVLPPPILPPVPITPSPIQPLSILQPTPPPLLPPPYPLHPTYL